MQIRTKMWWNIDKLADALDIYQTVSPPVGYGWGNKPSKTLLDTSYSNKKVKKVDFEWFKLKIEAEIDIFLHFLILRMREF